MPTIEIPDRLHARLAARAAAHGRSVEDEIAAVLCETEAADPLARVRQLRAQATNRLEAGQVEHDVRELRDAP